MEVSSGEVFGLLGPNGAGKSTLVKILLRLVQPTECIGHMLGKPIGHVPTLKRVGYLPEHVRFADHLTPADMMDFAGKLCGMSGIARSKRIQELLLAVGMEQWKKERLGSFSKGMKQRVGLAQALMNDPDILFLDEPTDGVDPLGRKEIRDLILAQKARGKTVFVNSHLLGELELMCDRVAILSQGSVVRHGSVQELTRGGERYEIMVEGNLLDHAAILPLAQSLGGNLALAPDAFHTLVTIPSRRPQVVQPLIDEIRSFGFVIESVVPARQSLEDLFLDTVLTGRAVPPRLPQPEAGMD